MKLNLFTGKSGEAADMPVRVTERIFWKYFLEMVDIREARLTRKEIDVLSFIYSMNPEICYFTKPSVDIVVKSIPKLSIPELTRMKKKYIALGLVEEKNRKFFPTTKIKALKKVLEDEGLITLTFPIAVKYESAEK